MSEEHWVRMTFENMLCRPSLAAQMIGLVPECTGAVLVLSSACPAHGQHKPYLVEGLYNWAWLFQKQVTKTQPKVA